jgi:uncharacterized RDD family membrane protein YckC
METISEPLIVLEPAENIRYATFWYRFGAVIIELINLPFKMYYGNEWGNTLFFTLLALIGITYKPFMEYRYGATFGKMALKLKVVNMEYKKATLIKILLRNIFNISSSIIFLIINGIFYNAGEIKKLASERSASHHINFGDLPHGLIILLCYSFFCLALYAVDALFLVSDNKARALHDRIGKTYVIDTKEPL